MLESLVSDTTDLVGGYISDDIASRWREQLVKDALYVNRDVGLGLNYTHETVSIICLIFLHCSC